MRKVLFFMLLLVIGLSAMAQQKIQLRSADKAECVSSDMKSLKASFSFSTIEAEDYKSDRGTFSWLSLPNTVLGGDVGEPQLPVINELIAVPFGATPRIEITSYSTTDYSLAEYGMKTLVPRQLPVHKNQNLEDVPFVMNEAAYQTRGLRSEPQATVSVDGTMRGVQLGNMTINPVCYDPVNNIIRVFNDIEVTVTFDGADLQATEDMLMKTYSPAFEPVYSQLFNNSTIRSAYTDHPDLYNTPVRILVICYSGFRNNDALNSWLQWKLQKGYAVDIFYTDETGTTASSIASFIKTKYNASVSAGNAYTYLIVIGDTGQVPYYMVKNIDSSIGNCASDLGYASVNFSSSTSNYFPDMYYSRMSVENTTQLANYINKVLTYEKYEFADGGNYLNNVLLVGGYDANWTSRVAKPTINYGANNYFNTSNTTYGGFSGGTIHAVISTSSSQGYSGTNNGVYNGINDGACLVNYTAHGDKQEWQVPQFTAAQVATLTNTGKYFFGIGNCCLTGNFNNTTTSYSPGSAIGANACFGETMIRVPNAGAIAYIGCSPYSYWYEDFYWAVGAHSYSQGNAPSVSSSTVGVYDAMFDDANWNSASALLYLGNLAVQQAVTNGNTTSSITDGNCNNSAHYYFQFYHTFGDGSVMPYITKPEANTVTIPSTVTPGTTSITVNAVAGSYVAVTDNSSVIYGVGVANASGVATVNFTESIPVTGTLYVVVTRQQYQPYFGTIQIVGGTQYNITVTQPQHGTISAPAQAYANSTVTLTATPETGYCLSSWTVKKGNTNITVTNNQFTMPEGNVTVTATFVQGLEVTLANVQHGTISADPVYALQGTTINLTATPAAGYEFGSWTVYKTGDPNTTVTVNGNSFTMPNYAVTVSASFVLGPTELTVYDGTATNQYIPMYGYYFDEYTKSECIIPASALTAMNGSLISAITFYPSSVGTTNSTWGNASQTVFLKEVSGTTLGGSFSGTSGATTVKQGLLEMPTAGEPYTITFDDPYTYNGGNLLIGVYNTEKGSYNKVEWYGTSNLTSGVSAYGNKSNSLNNVSYNAQSFLPKTTFTYMPPSDDPVEITASVNPANAGTVTGAGTYDPGTTVTLTATANEGYTFTNWTRNGVVISTNATYNFTASNVVDYVANFTINSYDITATANPTDGGTVIVGNNRGNRGDLVYDFEDGWQGWTTFQGNTTSPHSWMHKTEYYAFDSNGNQIVPECHNSTSGMMLSESYISASTSGGSGTAVTPDNYLVSPQFRLGGSFTFYAASRMSNYPAEKFSVLVSESGNTSVSDFTHTELTVTLSDNSWNEYTVDLSEYSGMGYVAIRHYDCNDQHLLYIDDVTIVEGQDPSTDNGNFNYGETCVLTATPNEGYRLANWTENGNVVSSDASYTFTVTGDRDLVANFTTTVCGIVLDENDEWFENFDTLTTSTEKWTGITMGDCWTWTRTVDLHDGDIERVPQIYYNSNFAHSDNYSLRLEYRGVYAMPELDTNININQLKMSFYVRQSQTFYTLLVGVMTDPTAPETFEMVAHIDNGASTGVEYAEVNFANYPGEGRYIAFKNVRPAGSEYDGNWNDNHSVNYIDDIKLSLIESDNCSAGIAPGYTEDFETVCPGITVPQTGVEPACWEMVNPDVDIRLDKYPQVYYESDNYSLRMVDRCVYAMPVLAESVTDIKTLQLEMDVRQPYTFYQLQVGVWEEDSTGVGTFVPVATVNNSVTTEYVHFTCNFSHYSGNGGRIAFRNTLNGGARYDYSYNYIDNIALTEIESGGCSGIVPGQYTENFDNVCPGITVAQTGMEPACWEMVNPDVDLRYDKYPQVYYSMSESIVHSGNYSLRMADRCVYAMPAVAEGYELQDLTLTMWVAQPQSFYDLTVGVWEENENGGTFVPVQKVNVSSEFEEVTVDFSSYPGDGGRIAFRNTLNGGARYNYSYSYIDDIELNLTANKIAENGSANVIDEIGVERYLEGIAVYPNPTVGELHIGATDVQKVECYNQMGQLVAVYDNENTISLNNLANGVYMLRITVPQGVTMRKVVKR